MVVENQGIPLGDLIASANRAEITLAEAAPATLRVPISEDGLAAAAGNWLPTGATILDPFETGCASGESSPVSPKDRAGDRDRRREAEVFSYPQRWVVERTFAWLHNFRRLVVRCERKAQICFGFVLLAFVLWLTNLVLK